MDELQTILEDDFSECLEKDGIEEFVPEMEEEW